MFKIVYCAYHIESYSMVGLIQAEQSRLGAQNVLANIFRKPGGQSVVRGLHLVQQPRIST